MSAEIIRTHTIHNLKLPDDIKLPSDTY